MLFEGIYCHFTGDSRQILVNKNTSYLTSINPKLLQHSLEYSLKNYWIFLT